MKKKAKSKYVGGTDSHLEEAFLVNWRISFPNHHPKLQHIFARPRLYRFDFAWIAQKVAVEIQGYGVGHASRKGLQRDYQKNNLAISLGWKVLYFSSRDLEPRHIRSTINKVAEVLNIANLQGRPRQYINTVNTRRRKPT